jgi:pimeloyl-ACP methyl ester carboxylesterase
MTAGDPDNPAIILLHGFPEFWYGWKRVADLLVERGFYCILPDQRGYNLSDTPFRVKSYRLRHLVDDIADLIAWTGRDRVFLAGHDWGAIVSWAFVSTYPELVEKVVIVNVPHPGTMRETLRQDRGQLRKSWYIFFFQLPLLPQLSLRLFNFRMLKRSLVGTSRPGTFPEDVLEDYVKSWKGNVRTMINWYRALIQYRSSLSWGRIDVPVLILWGKKDLFLSEGMASRSLDHCSDGELLLFDATHWILREEPDLVADHMSSFYTK